MTDTIVVLTGHRPERIPDPKAVTEQVKVAYYDIKPDYVITGMAAGFDLLAGNIALDLEIPIICAKPWRGHSPRKGDEEAYARLIKYADEVVNVTDSQEFPGNWCYHARNEWMVNHGTHLLACWDGHPKGGTYACWRYAKKQGLPHRRIDPLG